MIIPIEITADRIEPAGLHLFEHITPEIRAGVDETDGIRPSK